MMFHLPACVAPCYNQEGCPSIREEDEMSVEMNGTAFGMSDEYWQTSMSRPVRIERRHSRSSPSSTKSSPTETFLSANSPCELPFVPPAVPRTRDHAVPKVNANDSVHEFKWSEHQQRKQVMAKSLIASSFDQQSPQERLVNRRQLLRKEQFLAKPKSSPIAKQHQTRRSTEERPYSYIDITTW